MQKEISELREQIKDQNNVITKLMHKLETIKNRVHNSWKSNYFHREKAEDFRVHTEGKCKSWKQLEQRVSPPLVHSHVHILPIVLHWDCQSIDPTVFCNSSSFLTSLPLYSAWIYLKMHSLKVGIIFFLLFYFIFLANSPWNDSLSGIAGTWFRARDTPYWYHMGCHCNQPLRN